MANESIQLDAAVKRDPVKSKGKDKDHGTQRIHRPEGPETAFSIKKKHFWYQHRTRLQRVVCRARIALKTS